MEYNMNQGYAKMIPNAKAIFTQWDHNKIKRNFPCINMDKHYIYLNFIYEPYKLDRRTGDVWKLSRKTPEECSNPFEIISIMDMLCSEKELHLTNDWCPISHFAKYSSIGEKSEREIYGHYVEYLSDNIGPLHDACKALGGTEYTITKSADVCFKIDVFDYFPVIFQFWDRDEEFPAQIKILWDKNTMNYLLFETSYYVVACILERIKQCIR